MSALEPIVGVPMSPKSDLFENAFSDPAPTQSKCKGAMGAQKHDTAPKISERFALGGQLKLRYHCVCVWRGVGGVIPVRSGCAQWGQPSCWAVC